MSATTDLRELNARTADGLDVQLLWSPQGETFVRVTDRKYNADPVTFEVSPADAGDAFRHPYAYLGRQLISGVRQVRFERAS